MGQAQADQFQVAGSRGLAPGWRGRLRYWPGVTDESGAAYHPPHLTSPAGVEGPAGEGLFSPELSWPSSTAGGPAVSRGISTVVSMAAGRPAAPSRSPAAGG